MGARTDTFDLASLSLTPGEARRLDLEVTIDDVGFGGQDYAIEPQSVAVTVDLTKMVHNGWSLRLRFGASLSGPCMRCLQPAEPFFDIDAREIDQPNMGEDLDSPYVSADEQLDLRGWVRDAFALALPTQVLCRPECAGLCATCGANLNDEPGHEHEPEPDPRWAALRDIELN
jgi:uncharacterized protein